MLVINFCGFSPIMSMLNFLQMHYSYPWFSVQINYPLEKGFSTSVPLVLSSAPRGLEEKNGYIK
jgi:hypothetical protein